MTGSANGSWCRNTSGSGPLGNATLADRENDRPLPAGCSPRKAQPAGKAGFGPLPDPAFFSRAGELTLTRDEQLTPSPPSPP